jgi:hypothetical protein
MNDGRGKMGEAHERWARLQTIRGLLADAVRTYLAEAGSETRRGELELLLGAEAAAKAAFEAAYLGMAGAQ